MKAMRTLFLALLLALGLIAPAFADQSDPRLAGLFRALKEAPDEAAAKPIELAIWTAWLQSDSPSVDLLVTRGIAALDAKDYATARALFDAVTELAPQFAEGWNRRASARFLTGDETGAVGDLERTLMLEPRHFGALLGLGAIFEERDELKAALEAFRRALAINPFLPEAEKKVRALEQKLEGRGI